MGDHSAAASTMGFRGTSGPTALKGPCVAGMWQRNAAITMRYAVMHGTIPCVFQAPTSGQGKADIFAYSAVIGARAECPARFASATTKKGAVEGIEPSLSAERSFELPGDDRDRYKIPLAGISSPLPDSLFS
jgi:hypothetical protein